MPNSWRILTKVRKLVLQPELTLQPRGTPRSCPRQDTAKATNKKIWRCMNNKVAGRPSCTPWYSRKLEASRERFAFLQRAVQHDLVTIHIRHRLSPHDCRIAFMKRRPYDVAKIERHDMSVALRSQGGPRSWDRLWCDDTSTAARSRTEDEDTHPAANV